MKKKKAQHTAASDPSPSTSATSFSVSSDADLKALIHEHSLFFDRLVELIPARFYLPVDEKERPWFHGLSKAAKASAKKQSRENRKKARRERLDPEKSATTLDLLKKSIEAGKEDENQPESVAGDDTGNKDADAEGSAPCNRAVTFEELQQRLRRRIEQLRAQRNSKNPVSAEAEEDKKAKKRKRNEKGEGFEHKELRDAREVEDGEKKQKDASSVEFSFGHVKLGEGNDRGRKKKRLPKEMALKKAEQLQAAMKDPEKGGAVHQKHSWMAAVSRAAGEKVHDDPRLIKESLKKDKKRREKAAGKWKEREETKRKLMDERQKKRADNISEKIHQKKMKKIEKREKKLMRPGFEGRKEGYVNDS